jgi:hypothetical protein
MIRPLADCDAVFSHDALEEFRMKRGEFGRLIHESVPRMR